jgi:hypothetical protein
MKGWTFKRSPLDIAPGAKRYTASAWRIFGAGLVALLLGLLAMAQSVLEAHRLHEEERQRQSHREAEHEIRTAAMAQRKDADLASSSLQIKAHQLLQHRSHMSWFGLFDALETAAHEVRGGVSLLSLTPSAGSSDSAQVRLSAVAVNAQVMLKYLKALRKDPRILSVELHSQQLDDQIAAGALRMQLSVRWYLTAVDSLPSTRPTASPSESNASVFNGVLP